MPLGSTPKMYNDFFLFLYCDNIMEVGVGKSEKCRAPAPKRSFTYDIRNLGPSVLLYVLRIVRSTFLPACALATLVPGTHLLCVLVSISSGKHIEASKAYEPNVIEVTDSESGVEIDLRGR